MGKFMRKEERIASDEGMIEGMALHFQGTDLIVLDGIRYTREDLTALLRRRIAAAREVIAAKAAWQTAVTRERAVAAKTARTISALRQTVHLMFASQLEALADFGVTPHKEKRPLTSEEKLVVVAKILATRRARHTLGKRQRAAIQGGATPPTRE
jgi:ABC-type hemin transport system ATPase subunit